MKEYICKGFSTYLFSLTEQSCYLKITHTLGTLFEDCNNIPKPAGQYRDQTWIYFVHKQFRNVSLQTKDSEYSYTVK